MLFFIYYYRHSIKIVKLKNGVAGAGLNLLPQRKIPGHKLRISIFKQPNKNTPYQACFRLVVAGEGFEPPSSRLWASRAAAALPRDKNILL